LRGLVAGREREHYDGVENEALHRASSLEGVLNTIVGTSQGGVKKVHIETAAGGVRKRGLDKTV